MNAIILLYNKKKGTVRKEGSTWEVPLQERMEVPIDIQDLTTQGKVGFEALHERLQHVADVFNFKLQPVIEQLATTSLFRFVHCTRGHGLPRYIVKQMFDMLVDAKACIWEGAAVKKTASYVVFLRNVVHIEETAATITSGRKKHTYVIPKDLDSFSSIMIGEEIRIAEEHNTHEPIMKQLREAFRAKKWTEELSPKGKRKTEMERVSAAIAEEAEYDDRPSTKQGGKRVKK